MNINKIIIFYADTPSYKMGPWFFLLLVVSCICNFIQYGVCNHNHHYLSNWCWYLCLWRIYTVLFLKFWELVCDYVVNEKGCSTRIPRWALLGDVPVLLISLAMFGLMPNEVCHDSSASILLSLKVNSVVHLVLSIWRMTNESTPHFAFLQFVASFLSALILLRSFCIF